MNVIGLSGDNEGKIMAELCWQIDKRLDIEPQMYSFRDPVFRVAKEMTYVFDSFVKKEIQDRSFDRIDMTGKELVDAIYRGAREFIHEDIWIHAMEARLDDGLSLLNRITYPNEAEWVSEHGTLVRLMRRDHGFTNDFTVQLGGDGPKANARRVLDALIDEGVLDAPV